MVRKFKIRLASVDGGSARAWCATGRPRGRAQPNGPAVRCTRSYAGQWGVCQGRPASGRPNGSLSGGRVPRWLTGGRALSAAGLTGSHVRALVGEFRRQPRKGTAMPSEPAPEVLALVDAIKAHFPDVGGTVTDAAEARRILAAGPAWPFEPPRVGSVEDRAIPGPEGAPEIPVRIYRPEAEPSEAQPPTPGPPSSSSTAADGSSGAWTRTTPSPAPCAGTPGRSSSRSTTGSRRRPASPRPSTTRTPRCAGRTGMSANWAGTRARWWPRVTARAGTSRPWPR